MASFPTESLSDQQALCPWSLPGEYFSRSDLEDEAHVWRAFVDLDFETAGQLEQRLNIDERLRAGRFRFPKDRIRFVAARSMLRQVIAGYISVADHEVIFEYGPYGKPFLHRRFGSSCLTFNLSHSGSMALLVVTSGRQIGIDVELMRPNLRIEEVAQQYFSKWEVMELCSLPPEMRLTGFFNCWTRKEAYVKASGFGLQTPLDKFQVSLSPPRPPRFIRGVSSDWQLASFVPASGYIAAIANTGRPATFTWRDWQFSSPGEPPIPADLVFANER